MKKSVTRGLSALLSVLFVLSIFGGIVANNNAGVINITLGITGANTVGDGEIYYASAYGDFNAESQAKMVEAANAFVIREAEEGSVLLKNDGVLPLSSSVKNVSLFGRASVDLVTTGNSERSTTLPDALSAAGFSVNQTLADAYSAAGLSRVAAGSPADDIAEVDASFYTSAIKQSCQSYKDAAIVVLSRVGGEGQDISTLDKDGVSTLALHPQERAIFDVIQEIGFDKVIVLIDSAYPMDINWIDECGVNACLWVGAVASIGIPGIVNLLTGEANPSGKLPYVWATNSMSAPAMQNFGNRNHDGGDVSGFTFAGYDGASASAESHYVVYQEGIYVGYKYYETRYEDSILGQGNATSDVGALASTEGWSYADEVMYPLGYGLSYTSFKQELTSLSYDAGSDTFNAVVKVTNTGKVPGRSVVELYVQSPYTAYDQQHGVEKSAIQVAAYDKTGILGPNESEEVTLSYERYLLASYDVTAHDGQGGYIIDDGTYYFAIGDNSHDALNNILAAKGAQGMVDWAGEPVVGDASKVQSHVESAFDDTSYQNSVYTGETVANLYDFADVNYYYDNDPVTYLSRSDWAGTWAGNVKLSWNDKIKEAVNTDLVDETKPSKTLNDVTFDVDNGKYSLVDMFGKDYDDPDWKPFIESLSLDDVAAIMNDNYGTVAVSSIGKPAAPTVDGPEGPSGSYLYADGTTTKYVCAPTLTATWSPEIYRLHGEFYGEDCLYAGIPEANSPGADTIRTPYGGRTPQYWSEDGLMSFYVGEQVVAGMRSKGVVTTIKHFFLNDQEYSRQGVCTFANEQAIREIYLRAFEGGVVRGGAVSLMTGYNRVGCRYCAVDDVSQNKLFRNEWGFDGYTVTDYVGEGAYSNTESGMLYGTNVFGAGGSRAGSIRKIIATNNNGDLMEAAQESSHRVLYAFANSLIINGLSSGSNSVSTGGSWWQTTILVLQIAFGAAFVGVTAVYVWGTYFKKKGDKK